ncbi:hypothetical protein SJ05684_c30690 [Sinorhizobium sojae CCBAU 05684]|uniref:Uncharacterized protein n=1 Tax=Sinorhizobium sojae CCBAU 05684 TaxID=716928 RepID=A0A249PEX0_9HYPH|nr:hypothetical protein SJ05684_c30690 [Sinorhizobium sojae CCBAU 05684]
MPGHPQHRCHYPFIECRLAQFFACKSAWIALTSTGASDFFSDGFMPR